MYNIFHIIYVTRIFRIARYLPIVLVLWLGGNVAQAEEKNGFNLSAAIIPTDEILFGGPPRDGIPSIDSPQFSDADADEVQDFLQDDDLILGVQIDGDARAYPIKILNWHEIVNDRFGDKAVVVTYCPLCGSGAIFNAIIGDSTLQFGVSGLLYNSDVLLYDRQSESLWSQLLRRGVSGLFVGTTLSVLPAQHTTWKAWRQQHPQTRVLSPQTGFSRDYQKNPYAGYAQGRRTYFPVKARGEASVAADKFHPKEWVLGVLVGDVAKAYPFSELQKQGQPSFTDVVGGQPLTIVWDEEAQAAKVQQADENEVAAVRANEVAAVRAFWFAWHAFYPQGAVFSATP